MATTWGSLKTTAFIVSLAIAFVLSDLLLGIPGTPGTIEIPGFWGIRKSEEAKIESEESPHNCVASQCYSTYFMK